MYFDHIQHSITPYSPSHPLPLYQLGQTSFFLWGEDINEEMWNWLKYWELCSVCSSLNGVSPISSPPPRFKRFLEREGREKARLGNGKLCSEMLYSRHEMTHSSSWSYYCNPGSQNRSLMSLWQVVAAQ